MQLDQSAVLSLARLHSPRRKQMHRLNHIVDQLAISRRSFDFDWKSVSVDHREQVISR